MRMSEGKEGMDTMCDGMWCNAQTTRDSHTWMTISRHYQEMTQIKYLPLILQSASRHSSQPALRLALHSLPPATIRTSIPAEEAAHREIASFMALAAASSAS
jgi:hypothetical protein